MRSRSFSFGRPVHGPGFSLGEALKAIKKKSQALKEWGIAQALFYGNLDRIGQSIAQEEAKGRVKKVERLEMQKAEVQERINVFEKLLETA